MWLLNTATAELKFFSAPEHVPGGYAILSHVWQTDAEEDTFQSVRAAATRYKQPASDVDPCSSSVPARMPLLSPGREDLQHEIASLSARLQHLALLLEKDAPQ